MSSPTLKDPYIKSHLLRKSSPRPIFTSLPSNQPTKPRKETHHHASFPPPLHPPPPHRALHPRSGRSAPSPSRQHSPSPRTRSSESSTFHPPPPRRLLTHLSLSLSSQAKKAVSPRPGRPDPSTTPSTWIARKASSSCPSAMSLRIWGIFSISSGAILGRWLVGSAVVRAWSVEVGLCFF